MVREVGQEFDKLCVNWREGSSEALARGFIKQSLENGLLCIKRNRQVDGEEVLVSDPNTIRREIQAFFDHASSVAETADPEGAPLLTDQSEEVVTEVSTWNRTRNAGLKPKEFRWAGEYGVEMVRDVVPVREADETGIANILEEDNRKEPLIDFGGIFVLPASTEDSETSIQDEPPLRQEDLGEEYSDQEDTVELFLKDMQ